MSAVTPYQRLLAKAHRREAMLVKMAQESATQQEAPGTTIPTPHDHEGDGGDDRHATRKPSRLGALRMALAEAAARREAEAVSYPEPAPPEQAPPGGIGYYVVEPVASLLAWPETVEACECTTTEEHMAHFTEVPDGDAAL
jgi:hypothetical protein